MKPHITWLASYPKSGNTWIRFIVFFLVNRRLPSTSRELDLFASSRLPSCIAEAPEFCRSVGSKLPEPEDGTPIFCKTHASADALAPLIPRTRRAIYIVRSPLDVLNSALNYAKLTGELAPDENPEEWIRRYVEFGGNPLWSKPGYASRNWRENVREWKSCDAFPVLWLSYEQMLSNTRDGVIHLADFLGCQADESLVDACVKATSFQSLRDFENREIDEAVAQGRSQGRFSVENRMAAVSRGVRFFNRGGEGGSREWMSQYQIEKALAKFEPEASQLGYEVRLARGQASE